MTDEKGPDEQQEDPVVVKFIHDTYFEAGSRGLTYVQLIQVVERLHLTALFHRFGGDADEVADYLEAYGENVADMIDSGAIRFIGEAARPVTVH